MIKDLLDSAPEQSRRNRPTAFPARLTAPRGDADGLPGDRGGRPALALAFGQSDWLRREDVIACAGGCEGWRAMAAKPDRGQVGDVAGSAEAARLAEIGKGIKWRQWGPYVSDRQWGTVREDYSPFGTAWEYLPHDHARSRAYRWGEDGIGGFGDEQLLLCLGLALWNGNDPILKERLFGLTNSEGNHGEDVKERYWFVDGVPSHSWMRWQYHYPQQAF